MSAPLTCAVIVAPAQAEPSWATAHAIQGLLALFVLVTIGGAADGQITLLPGTPTLVSQAPKYITAADFNHDGVLDVAVAGSTSGKATVLFGTRSGSFGSVVDLSGGQLLLGVQAGDLNGDGIPDIALLDLLSRVFVVTSNGNGTFNQPVSYPVGLRPIDIAIGHFDRQTGNELVVCSQGTSGIGSYLNQRQDSGFSALRQVPVGASAKRCKAADLNGDGLDDIIVISSAAGATDDVSVLLNNGAGGFLTATHFVVGAGAADLAIADFNNDGVPDIAVLNAGSAPVQSTFTVSILLNQTTVVDCKRIGTGSYVGQTPVTVSCPSTLAGIPIFCHPNYIAAGDFDNDGFNDFAVTLLTQPQAGAGSLATPGLVQAFKGQGNGSFDFSESVLVGQDPEGIVAGDFNGDGITDVAIAEQGSRSVGVLLAEFPVPPPGEGCHVGRQCASGFCVGGVCCSTASCPAGQLCNIPNKAGVCSPPAPDGSNCDQGWNCESGFCVGGFCCSTGACPSGEFCNSGTCAPPGPNSTPCNTNDGNGGSDQCISGHCTDGVCCADDRCPVGQACNIPGSEGVCEQPLANGPPCTVDGQCTSTFCTDGVCCGVRVCPSGQSCAIAPREGLCTNQPTPNVTATPGVIPTPTKRSCEDQLSCETGLVCACDPGAEMRTCYCVGDCSGDNQVTVDELLVMVNAALGNPAVCRLGDANGDGQISVDEILLAVSNLLHGCP